MLCYMLCYAAVLAAKTVLNPAKTVARLPHKRHNVSQAVLVERASAGPECRAPRSFVRFLSIIINDRGLVWSGLGTVSGGADTSIIENGVCTAWVVLRASSINKIRLCWQSTAAGYSGAQRARRIIPLVRLLAFFPSLFVNGSQALRSWPVRIRIVEEAAPMTEILHCPIHHDHD